MPARPSAGIDHSPAAVAPNGLARTRCAAMSGLDRAITTRPRKVALSSVAMASNVIPDPGRSR